MKNNEKKGLVVFLLVLFALVLLSSSGTLKTQSLADGECLINQHKCEGNILFTCTPDNTWGNAGPSPPNVAPDGSTCESTITVYRLENNLCSSLNIPESQRTANDYNTLVECESHIVTPPPPPGKFNLELILGIGALGGVLFFVFRYFKKRKGR